MNRRYAIKQLAIISGTMYFLPSCDLTKSDIVSAYSNLVITKMEKDILNKICAILIPTDIYIKGSDELDIPHFVLIIVNDCLSFQEQSTYMRGFRKFNKYFSHFKDLNSIDSFNMISQLYSNKSNFIRSDNEDIDYFMNCTKQFTIQGFITSEYFMTDIMPYNIAPGSFRGSVVINNDDKINIYD